MILTDREIQAAIQNGTIKVVPAPGIDSFSSTSLDLTLGNEVILWKPSTPGVEQIFAPADPNFNYSQVSSECSTRQVIGPEGLVLKPHQFMLVWTAETVNLPPSSGIAARVEGKSSLARLGIGVHVTAPTIHAGFSGTIQLEICNHGPLHIRLQPAMRICQLIFEQTYGTPEKGYQGQFQNQS